MAQALRPPPKRRPSQISTQTSAISSLPSSQSRSSQPNGPQLPNISECAALAEKATPIPSASIPHAEASEDSSAIGAAAAAAMAENEDMGRNASKPGAQEATEPAAATSAEQGSAKMAAQTSSSCADQGNAKAQVEKPQRSMPEDYVSPFEQAQEPAAVSAAQKDSPFANVS
jgi:uncharacterized membrane protein